LNYPTSETQNPEPLNLCTVLSETGTAKESGMSKPALSCQYPQPRF